MRTETCPLFAFAKRADKFLGGYVRSSELRRAISEVPRTPRVLFTLLSWDEYFPTQDGQRFLVNRIVATPPPVSIILNWKPQQH
jgi:hypothetical protein